MHDRFIWLVIDWLIRRKTEKHSFLIKRTVCVSYYVKVSTKAETRFVILVQEEFTYANFMSNNQSKYSEHVLNQIMFPLVDLFSAICNCKYHIMKYLIAMQIWTNAILVWMIQILRQKFSVTFYNLLSLFFKYYVLF